MRVFQKNSNIFNLLSEGVSEGIIVINRDRHIVATNSAAEEMFGYTKEEMLEKPLNTLIPSKFHKVHDSHVSQYLDGAGRRRMAAGRELYGIRNNGLEFPVEVGLNPFALYDRNYVMALVMDVTERRSAERELRHWAKIFDESLNEIYIFDAASLYFVKVNRGAMGNIGYSEEELKELTPINIKPEYNKVRFKKLIKPLIDKDLEKLEFETVHLRKDGTTYPVEVHMQLSDLGGQEVFVAIILDITDRKDYTNRLERTVAKRTEELQKALEKEKELNELKTRFLSLVSHEFKTPLSSILTSSTLLSKYTQTEHQPKRDKHIDTIRNKVKHLDTILNDFLSVERLESGKVNYKYTTFALSKLVNEVVYDANMLLKSGQRIHYPSEIDDLVITSDEKILELILSNLLHNAIKYSLENTTIGIEIKENKNSLRIEVIDQGIGIPEEDQKFIFNRYFRAKNALLNQGTGIGLNIVKQHLENLGGTIAFQSIENEGTTFVVELPLNNANPN